MEIGTWLRSIGLEQYEQTLRDNAIDGEVLVELTDADLEKLGILLGHRKKMLKAIAALRSDGEAAVTAREIRAPLAPVFDAAERRQVTVMFCDLVGSTALSTRLDPEDLREVIAGYHTCVAQAVDRFDGFIAKYMGDGALVYFGYPEAHEDDAERAVRAGLAVAKAVDQLVTSAGKLQARIGIATGLVVVGDLMGTGEAQERGIVGETPNLAARLQAIAEPNGVVIAASTHGLLGRLFEYRDLGPVEAKGFTGPIAAWRVVGDSTVESRFEALHSRQTPLVGREEEMELLIRRWVRAKSGEGQVVLLSGEPGIGKSRIIAALEERLQSDSHLRLSYFCSPYTKDSALRPVIAQIQRAAGFAADDPLGKRLHKLTTLLGPMSSAEDVVLLADLLSIPAPDRYAPLALNPQQRKERTLAALLRQLEAPARNRPVLMIFEDVHWIDATSRELLERVIERVPSLPVLLIVTFRPEFQPPWVGSAHVAMHPLNRLSRREGAALVEKLAGKPLPPEVANAIVERTDGVPLFVEELTKAVLEGGLVQEGSRQVVSGGRLPHLAIPTTLQASLMARLDRLEGAKEVAQIGACIGREFSHELLAAVTARPDAALQGALGRLRDAGLMFERGAAPHATYTFKHALVQDAAYGTLLRAKRQELHGRIAGVLERQFPDVCESQPEVLARHFAQAGLAEPAINYWQRAGDRSAKQSANQEAAAHLRNALDLLEALPNRARHADQELQLLIALGPALMTTRSSAAPEIGRVYARARELARSVSRAADLFPTVWGAWLVAYTSGDLATATGLVDELFELAGSPGNSALTLQAHHAAWPTMRAAGKLAGARQHVEAGLALYQRGAHAEQALHYGGHDLAVCGHVTDALLGAVCGYPDQAVRQMDRGLVLARDLRHPPTLIQALSFSAELRQIRREPVAVESLVAAVLPLLSEHGSAVGAANATMLRGWARIMQGEVDEGVAAMRNGLVNWRATGSKYEVPYRLARAAEAYRVAGDIDEGAKLVGEAGQHSNDRWFAPELHRLMGELLLAADRRDEAEECFQQALTVAREQGARLLELRAATSLARLWHDRLRNRNAGKLLATIYAWFTEGFDTPDLQDARVLLDRLG